MKKRISQLFRKQIQQEKLQDARFFNVLILTDVLTKEVSCGIASSPSRSKVEYDMVYAALDKARIKIMQMEQLEKMQEAAKDIKAMPPVPATNPIPVPESRG